MSASISYPSHLSNLKPYVPGLPIEDLARRLKIPASKIVKLASNENPFGASPMAVRAMVTAGIDFSRYPDNDCTDIVAALERHHGVPKDWIVAGAGSESVIGNAVATLLEIGRSTLYSQYSFQAFVIAAERIGATSIIVPEPELTVDLSSMRAHLDHGPALIYIANPGNPTGTCVDPEELESFIGAVPPHVVVVLDEAYFEYLPSAQRGDSIALVRRHPNLLVTRTFSKAYGLAGLRVGYGIAQGALADMLRRVRPPFTVSQMAQVAATAALHDAGFLEQTVDANNIGKGQLIAGLTALGFRHLPSSTNFLLTDVGDGAAWAHKLEQHGLIVRPLGSYRLPSWLRISIGTEQQNTRLLDAMARLRDSA